MQTAVTEETNYYLTFSTTVDEDWSFSSKLRTFFFSFDSRSSAAKASRVEVSSLSKRWLRNLSSSWFNRCSFSRKYCTCMWLKKYSFGSLCYYHLFIIHYFPAPFTSFCRALVSICFCLRANMTWSRSCWNATAFSCIDLASFNSWFSSPVFPFHK